MRTLPLAAVLLVFPLVFAQQIPNEAPRAEKPAADEMTEKEKQARANEIGDQMLKLEAEMRQAWRDQEMDKHRELQAKYNPLGQELRALGTDVWRRQMQRRARAGQERRVKQLIEEMEEDSPVLDRVRQKFASVDATIELNPQGIYGTMLDGDLKEHLNLPNGIYIVQIDAGTPADGYGLRTKDLLVSLEGVALPDDEEKATAMLIAFFEKEEGELAYIRAGAKVTARREALPPAE